MKIMKIIYKIRCKIAYLFLRLGQLILPKDASRQASLSVRKAVGQVKGL